MLLGVEMEHGQRRVELLRPRIVQGTLFRVPPCAFQEQSSDVCAVLDGARFGRGEVVYMDIL